MVGSIGPVGGAPQNVPQNTPIDTQQAIQLFNESSKVLDTEVQALSKEMMGKKEIRQGDQQNFSTTEAGKKPEYIPQAAEAMIGELAKESDVEKAKRKKSKWEDKMDELASLEGKMDLEQLQGEEKGIFQEFFDNMARIRNLRRKLKQLEEQEAEMERQKKREEQRKRDEEKWREQQKHGRENNPG